MTRNSEEIVNHSSISGLTPVAIDSDAGRDHVRILLALYQGAGTLKAQLDSFAGQSHHNWSLLVSDDGSHDGGRGLVQEFADRKPDRVQLVSGPGSGFAANFLSLLCRAGPHVPFAALSDQDDVWLPGKLARALSFLADVSPGRPAVYAGRTVICDHSLTPQRASPLWTRPPGFRNALVQSIAGGNTMVLNRAALDLVQETARHATGIIAHDWWIYQIVTGAGGDIIYDLEPQVLYRQHGGNQIGANDTILASLRRLVHVLAGRFTAWNTANIAALERANHWLTPEAREILAIFKEMRGEPLAGRLAALRRSEIYRQTRRGNAALLAAAILNKL